MSLTARLLIGACGAAITVAAAFADSVPRDSSAAPRPKFAAPGRCSAFRIGLTPEYAERERRADARRELAAREAERTERIVIYNKSGVRPCKHQLSVALAKGKCL